MSFERTPPKPLSRPGLAPPAPPARPETAALAALRTATAALNARAPVSAPASAPSGALSTMRAAAAELQQAVEQKRRAAEAAKQAPPPHARKPAPAPAAPHAHSSKHISQGEFAIGKAGDAALTTVLGSCVACCLHDPVARLGGMNHFLLPDGKSAGGGPASFGVNAMELLINALIRAGGDRRRFVAKVFGGARIVAGLSDVGKKNGEFIRAFLEAEQIPILAHSLGGDQARRVLFRPDTGQAHQRLLIDATLPEAPAAPAPKGGSDLELF